MERNYEDKYNIKLIGKVGEAIYNLPFYITKINDKDSEPYFQKYIFARYNPIDNCFYDFRGRNGDYLSIQNGDLSKLEVGMLINYSEFHEEWPEIVIPENPIIDKELVESKQLDYDALKKKYGDDLRFHRTNISLFMIIDSYCEKRIAEGKEVDPYIADIIYVIGREMGLKIATGGYVYDNRGYSYPEEIEMAVDGLYELLTLRFQEIDPFILPYEIHFNDRGYIPDDYKEFANQLVYVSGIYCDIPDIVNKIYSATYHRVDEKIIEQMRAQVPKFQFGKRESYYVPDSTKPNSNKQIIRRGTPCYNWSFLKKLSSNDGKKAKEFIR